MTAPTPREALEDRLRDFARNDAEQRLGEAEEHVDRAEALIDNYRDEHRRLTAENDRLRAQLAARDSGIAGLAADLDRSAAETRYALESETKTETAAALRRLLETPEPGAQWRVVHDATGDPVSEPFSTQEAAESLCAELNLKAGRDGWFGVRPLPQPAPELAAVEAKLRETAADNLRLRTELTAVSALTAEMHAEADASGDDRVSAVLHEYASRIRLALGPQALETP